MHKELRLHVAALLYFASRIAVVAFVFAVPALYFLKGAVEVPLVAGGAILVAGLFTGYYVAASGLRCAACSSPVLLDNGNRKHQHAAKFPGLNQRARVAWDILFQSSYQCMYCHTRCRSKKNWGGREPLSAFARPQAAAPASGPRESFPESIFESFRGSSETPEAEPSAETIFGAARGPSERVVTTSFTPASVFPGARTVPISLDGVPEPDPGAGHCEDRAKPTIDTSAFPPAVPRSPISPLPWMTPEISNPSADATIMNRSTRDTEPVQGPNPFLAAAAAMPPPPSPVLPYMPERNQPEPASPFYQEFPSPLTAASADAPPPWTLPSMPATPSRPMPPVSLTSPVRATSPVPAMGAVAAIPVAPVMPVAPTPPVAPVMAAAPPLATPVPQPPAAPVSSDLVREALAAIGRGKEALTECFESAMRSLESHLSLLAAAPEFREPAPSPATMSPLVAAPHVPTAAVPPAAPIPSPPPEPVATAPAPNPFPKPVTFPVQPRPLTAPVPAYTAAPVSAAVPVPPVHATPAPAVASAPQPSAPPEMPVPARRRFARPTGLAAEHLGNALQGAFESAPPPPPPAPAVRTEAPVYSNGNGYAPPVTAAIPAAPVNHGAHEPVHPRATAPVSSPFAVSDRPLSAPLDLSGTPAPFTFLQESDGHFSPIAPPAKSADYDPLDDTTMPWMQPIGA